MNNVNDHQHLVGLTVEDAQEAANDMGFNDVRVVPHNHAVTLEYRQNRITLYSKDNIIVAVMLG